MVVDKWECTLMYCWLLDFELQVEHLRFMLSLGDRLKCSIRSCEANITNDLVCVN